MLLCVRLPDGGHVEIEAREDETYARAIWLSGKMPPLPLCGGLGLCGNCAIRFASSPPEIHAVEKTYFSALELANGWRLGCRHFVPEGKGAIEIEIRADIISRMTPTFYLPGEIGNADVVLGVDLGTTSIQWRALQIANGDFAAEGDFTNPQAGAGPDVLCRLQFAATPKNRELLANLVWTELAKVIRRLKKRGLTIPRICVAANSAMTEILLNMDTSGLESEPWSLSFQGGEILETTSKEIPGSPQLIIPPLFSPFVGGDIAAGLIWLLDKGERPPFALADLGTNAEIALLADSEHLFLTSVPMGPAMEGVGPACGRPAAPGVVTRFQLGPMGIAPSENSANPRGISATGYLSMLAILLRLGILNREGQFTSPEAMPLAAKVASDIHEGANGPELKLTQDLFITASDVETLLKAKAAFTLGLRKIFQAAEITPWELKNLFLAGALGSHARIEDLETTGFLPPGLGARVRFIGNSSLAGACLLAMRPHQMSLVQKLKTRVLQLVDAADFQNDYVAAMRWG